MQPIAAAFALGVLALASACSAASSVEGKWCLVGDDYAMTISGGKITTNEGVSATYTVAGSTLTAREDGSTEDQVLTITDADTLNYAGPPPQTFKRCAE